MFRKTSILSYDAYMPRIGQAVSELIRQAAERPLLTETRNGLQVVRLARHSPKVTTERVDRLREEMP